MINKINIESLNIEKGKADCLGEYQEDQVEPLLCLATAFNRELVIHVKGSSCKVLYVQEAVTLFI